MFLPKWTIKVVLKQKSIFYLPTVNFTIDIVNDLWFISNVNIPDWKVTIRYDIDWCLCKPKNMYWTITNWFLFSDD